MDREHAQWIELKSWRHQMTQPSSPVASTSGGHAVGPHGARCPDGYQGTGSGQSDAVPGPIGRYHVPVRAARSLP
ncbi:hypothetical protein [Luteibacter sp.]|uniref:hypothetical protein n=1 Tax=Luteibacter sp. TaxID=1886636 RepID=UPI0039C8E0AC